MFRQKGEEQQAVLRAANTILNFGLTQPEHSWAEAD